MSHTQQGSDSETVEMEMSSSSSLSYVEGSCVSSEAEELLEDAEYPNNSPTRPMMLVGCPRCLMYVMLSDSNPKCPVCKSTVLLDFLNN